MTVTCEDCLRAFIKPMTGRYTSNCRECEARMLAHGPDFATAAMADALTVGYRDVLMNTFGADHWRTGHLRVKFWAERIEQAKGKA